MKIPIHESPDQSRAITVATQMLSADVAKACYQLLRLSAHAVEVARMPHPLWVLCSEPRISDGTIAPPPSPSNSEKAPYSTTNTDITRERTDGVI